MRAAMLLVGLGIVFACGATTEDPPADDASAPGGTAGVGAGATSSVCDEAEGAVGRWRYTPMEHGSRGCAAPVLGVSSGVSDDGVLANLALDCLPFFVDLRTSEVLGYAEDPLFPGHAYLTRAYSAGEAVGTNGVHALFVGTAEFLEDDPSLCVTPAANVAFSYDRALRQWQDLSVGEDWVPRLQPRMRASGDSFVIFDGFSCIGGLRTTTAPGGALWNAGTGEWRSLPHPDEVTWNAHFFGRGVLLEQEGGKRWVDLETFEERTVDGPVPTEEPVGTVLGGTREELLAVASRGEIWRLDPETFEWRSLPRSPVEKPEFVLSVRRGIAVFPGCGSGYFFERSTGTWSPLALEPALAVRSSRFREQMVSDGESIIALGWNGSELDVGFAIQVLELPEE